MAAADGQATVAVALAGSSRRPNLLVTGTPGTGKTETCTIIAERHGLRHIQVGELVKQEGLHEGFDEDHQSYTLDEDRLLDHLEPLMEEGGNVVDFHGCDLFPERWFDLVLVLTTDNTLLYDRLAQRNYSVAKVQENVQCEIMMVVLEEARESFPAEAVHAVHSNTIEDLESNVDRVGQWLAQWQANNNQ